MAVNIALRHNPQVAKNTSLFMDVGKRIARVRNALGLDQTEFGKTLDESNQAVWNWENGRALFPPRLLAKLFEEHGVDANYVYHNRQDTLPPNIRAAFARETTPEAPKKRPKPKKPPAPRVMH